MVPICDAHDESHGPFAQTPAAGASQTVSPIRMATVGVGTRWAFRTLSPVTVSSPIVRLRDVIKPLDPDISGWQRLSRSPIGLVPINGDPMVIDRDRLSKAIRNAEATPAEIDWVGPRRIQVHYDPSSSPSIPVSQSAHRQPLSSNGLSSNGLSPNGNSPVATAFHSPPRYAAEPNRPDSIGAAANRPGPSLSEFDAKRVVMWINTALERQHPSIHSSYQVDFDLKQNALVSLQRMTGVPSINPSSEIREGGCQFSIEGRGIGGPCKAVIQASLSAHPLVAFARKSLQRGHRLTSTDIVLKPLPESEMEPSFSTDPADLVGLEVRGLLRKDRPISRDDIRQPIVVRRGDLVDLRVVGGGLTVTTRAKAVSEGAESETIEVETVSPRKRLLARVVHPGLVEIVTRPPRVSR